MADAAEVIPFSQYLSPDRDRRRNMSMVLMRINNRNTMLLSLPGANNVVTGVSEIVVYEDEVPGVMALVEKRADKLKEAAERFDFKIAQQYAQEHNWAGEFEELQRVIRARSNPKINEEIDKMLSITPWSVEGEFHAIVGRSLLPLVSAEVLRTGIAEPQRIGMQAEQNAMAQSIVEGVTAANAKMFEAMASSIGDAIGRALDRALGGGDKSKGK